MKKSFLLLMLTMFLAVPAFAELTVEETTSTEYLKNYGYSTATVNAVHKSQARIAGEPLDEPVEKEYYNRPVVNFFRKVFMYIDPALDDHSFVNDHEIKTSPNYQDL